MDTLQGSRSEVLTCAASAMPIRTVLLDRDGTLIEDRHYLSDPEKVTLLPGVGEALSRLAVAGCRLFVVSNQSGIGRGYFPASAAVACQARLDQLLVPYGVRLEDAIWCPHAPEAMCFCRKPAVGLWEILREKHGLDAAATVMIGDKLDDLHFAINARLAAGILVLTGKSDAQTALPVQTSGTILHVAPALSDAAPWLRKG